MRSWRRSTRSIIRRGNGRSASGMEQLSDLKTATMLKQLFALLILSGAGLMAFVQASAQDGPAAAPPSADINNGVIHARLYLPNTAVGYYRATRFDWSGVM